MAESAGPVHAWSVGPYRDGDDEEILALFNSGFGQQRTLATWRWRFRDNPAGGPLASVARHREDGRIVGTYLCLPFGLDLDGERVPAAQVVDLVVHPDFRKQGMFEAMAHHSYAMLEGMGCRVQVAFPNPTAMSYPGFTRTLGWAPVALLRRYSARLDFERPLRRVLRAAAPARGLNAVLRALLGPLLAGGSGAAGGEFRFTRSRTLPDDYEGLWQACRGSLGLSFWKDAAYLRWRYDENPDHEFTYSTLHRSGKLVALAVSLEQDGAETICELLAAGLDAVAGRSLVARMRGEAFRLRRRSIGWYGNETAFAAGALRGMTGAREHGNVLVVHAHGDAELAAKLTASARWALAYGDPDFV